MKRIIMAALLALSVSIPAYAAKDVPGWDNLSDVQKAEIQKQIAVQAENNKSVKKDESVVDKVVPDAKKVDEWVNVGERVGKMMGGAAKEVGIAVNEFAASPVGLFTLGIILWKVMGGVLVHLFGGVAVWMIGAIVLTAIWRRSVETKVEYNKEAKNIFGNHPLVKIVRPAMSSDDAWGIFLGAAAFALAGTIVIFTY